MLWWIIYHILCQIPKSSTNKNTAQQRARKDRIQFPSPPAKLIIILYVWCPISPYFILNTTDLLYNAPNTAHNSEQEKTIVFQSIHVITCIFWASFKIMCVFCSKGYDFYVKCDYMLYNIYIQIMEGLENARKDLHCVFNLYMTLHVILYCRVFVNVKIYIHSLT